MDTVRLKYFSAVAETGSVRRSSPYKGRVCKTDVFLVKRKADVENTTMKQLAKAVRILCKTS